MANKEISIEHGNYDYFLVGTYHQNGGGYSDLRNAGKIDLVEKHASSELLVSTYSSSGSTPTGSDHILQRLFLIKSNNYTNECKIKFLSQNDLFWVVGLNVK